MLDGGFALATLLRQHGEGHPLPFAVGNIDEGPYQVGKRIPLPLCLFITNIAATGYIGLAFWEFRNATKGYLEPSKKIINIRQTLYLMFESGLLYSIIWAVIFFDLVFCFPPEGSIVLGLITPQITAIYPALIILLNATQKSAWATNGRDISTHSAVMSQASPPNILLTTQIQDTVLAPLESISSKSPAELESSAIPDTHIIEHDVNN
ncbi:hypothetical protein GYMLUDRAFT_399743 [Collybiopsis luxurians FD-317 M1]|nr:hypothetical protein GYMLUDRAFT_399743 [Collybiopsis luxurians FD-317 M1]